MGSAPSKPASKTSRRRHRRRKLRKHKRRPKVELDPSITSQRQSATFLIKNIDDIPELDSVSSASEALSQRSIVLPTGEGRNEAEFQTSSRRSITSPPQPIKSTIKHNSNAVQFDSISGSSEYSSQKPIKSHMRFSENTQINPRLDRKSPVINRGKALVDALPSTSQNRPSSVSHSVTNVKTTNALPNNMESPIDSYQSNNSSTRSSQDKLTKPLSIPSPIIVQPLVNQRQKSVTTEKVLPDIHKRVTPSPNKEHYRCKHCPHCQQAIQREVEKPSSSQPVWIEKPSKINNVHINMDEYDVDALRRTKLESDRVTNTYEYPPRLVKETKMNVSQERPKFVTFPAIAQMGPKIVPTHTPFPNYDASRHREHRLNKPFELKLFDD